MAHPTEEFPYKTHNSSNNNDTVKTIGRHELNQPIHVQGIMTIALTHHI